MSKKAVVSKKQVEALARLGCTQQEIATFFGVSRVTLFNNRRDIRQAWLAGRANLSVSLRRLQFGRAKRGSDTMLIFLGKQYLNQAEKVQNENKGQIVKIELPVEKEPPKSDE